MTLVRDIMHSGVLSVSEDLPVLDLASFMVHHGISGAPVIDAQGRPVGVVSLSDLVTHAAGMDRPAESQFQMDAWMDQDFEVESLVFDQETLTGDIMTKFMVSVEESTPLIELIELISRVKLHRILVIKGERLTGIVTTIDLVSHLGRLLKTTELAPL